MLSFRRDNGHHDEVETLDTLLVSQSMVHKEKPKSIYKESSRAASVINAATFLPHFVPHRYNGRDDYFLRDKPFKRRYYNRK